VSFNTNSPLRAKDGENEGESDVAVEIVERAGETRGLRRAAQRVQSVDGVADTSRLRCSVGIMAYNEEANIANAIETVLGQQLISGEITELIVVASGCTDRTAEMVADMACDDPRIRLIVQERREGKASAVNLFISAARSPILLMVSADVIVKEGTIGALLQHFQDPAVGMAGGHPIPVNDEGTFLGHAVHLLWRLHDQIAREAPKLGEIVAFRNVVPSIPFDTPVDEISIQALITQLGYQLVYEPSAVAYNRGPTTVGDFLRQRRRIYAGHIRIRKQQDYAASTMGIRRIFRALLRSHAFTTPRAALWTVAAVLLEATARALGYYDAVRRQQHYVWATVTTTKFDIAEGSGVARQQNVFVFQIVDFHRLQLELGRRAGRELSKGILRHIGTVLGSNALVSAQQNGTMVAILSGPREEAERTARSLVQGLATNGFVSKSQRDGVRVQLACGIIAFSQAGPPVARSIEGSISEDNLAPVGAN
jgi:biofilm PGA synthesis N-glycosyltransferase PgaC